MSDSSISAMATPFIEAVLKDYAFDATRLQRISVRKVPHPLEIVEPDPLWPETFERVRLQIISALGRTALDVVHSGSTSVPDLPAKPVIDIDLTVADVTDEAAYVPQLEAAGFQFLIREPHWHEHRFFCAYDPSVNLHVWGPGSPEVERHRIFKAWLLKNAEDKELYAKTKREALEISVKSGETVMQYNKRKEDVIRHILRRAFRDLGYIQ